MKLHDVQYSASIIIIIITNMLIIITNILIIITNIVILIIIIIPYGGAAAAALRWMNPCKEGYSDRHLHDL